MNPVSLAVLIVKVALCTLFLVAGLRLLFLSKEAFVNFTAKMLDIGDLEISNSTHIIVKVIGVLLAVGAFWLAYMFFWPDSVESNQGTAFSPTLEQNVTSRHG